MSLLLIDDQGEIWDGQSRKLRQSFGSPYSGGEFSDYAVANLGFVALNVYGGSCQVRLRPTVVSDRSFRALHDWLNRTRNERVVLTWLDNEWQNELLRAGPSSLRRIEELMAGARRALPNDFLSRLVLPEELVANSPLTEIVQQWSSLSQQSGQQGLMKLLELALGDRYVKVKPDAGSGRIVFHEFGEGLYGDYDTWRMCAVGAPIEEQPDRSFGKWVASAYREALDMRQPRVEQVDAIVRWPHAGRMRLRYHRVIVPVETPSGNTLLVGGSIINHRIDLRARR